MDIRQKLLVAGVMLLVTAFGAVRNCEKNPYTDRRQIVTLTPQQEIALGFNSVSEVKRQYGDDYRDAAIVGYVNEVGRRLVAANIRDTPYRFEFHVLDDPKTVNAFALPGGPVFITTGLLFRLETEAQLAGVLGHEIGHVVGRHSAERITEAEGIQGLGNAARILTYDPDNPGRTAVAHAATQYIEKLATLKFSRGNELESDELGVRFMAKAGYDPRAMIAVMEVLKKAAGGGGRSSEFFSTHPNPENREGRIEEHIRALVSKGVRLDGLDNSPDRFRSVVKARMSRSGPQR
jgi:predicted Zn-dependent protease